MYGLSADWNEYYREMEPGRRRALLEALSAAEPDDGVMAFRRRLLEARYADPKQPGAVVDRFLYCCVTFIQLSQNARIFRGHAAKQVRRALKDMLFNEAASLGEAGEQALYWELRNAAMRYYSSCDNPNYNRQLFGLMASSEAGRQERLCRDVWQMTLGLARFTGLGDELAPWNRAMLDAFATLDRDVQLRFEALVRELGDRGMG